MNVRQDQVIPGDQLALARAIFRWHIGHCDRCRRATWKTQWCSKGARLLLALMADGDDSGT